MAACSCHGVSDGECELITNASQEEERVTDFYFYFFKSTDPVFELLAQLKDMSFKIDDSTGEYGERIIKATKVCTMSRTLAYDNTFRIIWDKDYDGWGHYP